MLKSNSRPKKIIKREEFDSNRPSCSCPFSLLDDDSLREVLLRTRASDHPNLSMCCKRFRNVLSSTGYRKARSNLGWAEVKVELLDSFEQYKKHRETGCWEALVENPPPPSRDDSLFSNCYDHLGVVREYGVNDFHTESFRVYVDGWPLHKQESERNENRDFCLDVYLFPRNTRHLRASSEQYSGYEKITIASLFTNFGDARPACLRNALQDQLGGHVLPLMCISMFILPHEYRGTSSTVGPLILQDLLRAFKDEYSVAIYIPKYACQLSLEEDEAEEDSSDSDDSGDSGLELTERQLELENQDTRQFFRAGFRLVDDASVTEKTSCSFVFVTPQDALESILTEQQALDLPVRASPPSLSEGIFDLFNTRCVQFRLLSEASKDECIKDTSNEIMKILSKCETMEDRLGVILDSEAIFFCTTTQNMPFLYMLLKFLPDPLRQTTLVLNHMNKDGDTPLMNFAFGMGRIGEHIEPELAERTPQFIESILSLGADKNMVNTSTGLSALGCFREGLRESRCSHVNHLRRRELDVRRIEEILTPDGGATQADKDLELEAGEVDSDEEDPYEVQCQSS